MWRRSLKSEVKSSPGHEALIDRCASSGRYRSPASGSRAGKLSAARTLSPARRLGAHSTHRSFALAGSRVYRTSRITHNEVAANTSLCSTSGFAVKSSRSQSAESPTPPTARATLLTYRAAAEPVRSPSFEVSSCASCLRGGSRRERGVRTAATWVCACT